MNQLNLSEKLNFKIGLILSSVFFVFLLIMFREFVFDSSQLVLANDQLNGLGQRFLRDGIMLPQWNPYLLGGMPTFDAMFGDAMHPLVILESIFGPGRGVGWKFMLCIQVAFSSGLLLFSRISGSWKIGAIFSLLFALNPQFASHVFPGHDGKMMVVAILPTLIYGLYKLTRDGKISGIIIMAVSLAWMMLSSHIQMTYFALWGLFILSIGEIFFLQSDKLSIQIKIKRQLLMGITVAIGMSIGALQLLPPYMYTTTQSVRGSGDKVSIGHASSWSAHPEEIMSIINPSFVGHLQDSSTGEQSYWGINAFKLNQDSAGIILLLLGLLAFSRKKHWKENTLWAWVMSLVVMYSIASHTPFFELFYNYLPGVKNFRAGSMVLFWIPMALAVLGSRTIGEYYHSSSQEKKTFFSKTSWITISSIIIGAVILRFTWASLDSIHFTFINIFAILYGLQLLWCQQENKILNFESIQQGFLKGFKGLEFKKALIILSPFSLFFIVKTSTDLKAMDGVGNYFREAISNQVNSGILNIFNSGKSNVLFTGIGSLIILGAIIWILKEFQNREQNFSKAWAGLIVLALIESHFLLSPFIQTSPLEKSLPSRSPIAEAIHKSDPSGEFRTMALGNLLNQSSGAYHKLRFIGGFHDNEIASYREFKGGQKQENLMYKLVQNNLVDNPFLNIIGAKHIILPGQNGVQFLQNTKAFKRATYYNSWSTTPAKYTDSLKLGFDYQNKVYVEGLTNNNTPHPFPVETKIQVIKPDHLNFTLNSPQAGMLFVNENFQPFWQATVNGKEAKVHKAFGTFIAIEIPEGDLKVELKYVSASLEMAIWIALAGLLALLLIFGIKFRKPSNND
jgi:hypothetical protein